MQKNASAPKSLAQLLCALLAIIVSVDLFEHAWISQHNGRAIVMSMKGMAGPGTPSQAYIASVLCGVFGAAALFDWIRSKYKKHNTK
jgi:hypothetical protein